MTRAALLAATASCSAASAFAATEPPPCSTALGADRRVRCIAATAETVVTLKVQRGASVMIEAPDGERVVAVPVSDDAIMRGGGRASVRVASSEEDGKIGRLQIHDGHIRNMIAVKIVSRPEIRTGIRAGILARLEGGIPIAQKCGEAVPFPVDD